MFRHRFTLLVIVAVLIGLMAAPAGASPPEDVRFEGPSFIAGPNAGTGSFIATGPAADSGLVCPEGATTDLYTKAAPPQGQSPSGVNLQVLKEFTCDDGSGTFQVKLQVRIDFRRGVSFNWVIVGGTGDYEDLKGNGSGFVAFEIPDGVYDVYDGKLH